MVSLAWGIDILFANLTPEQGDDFEKHPFHYVAGGGDFLESFSSFSISLVSIFSDSL